VLLNLWPELSGTYDPNGCWLIPKQRTNGRANRSKVWLPKGTAGWGETVERKGGYVIGYEYVCTLVRGPRPPAEVDPDPRQAQALPGRPLVPHRGPDLPGR
jgi:hypothetical protein